MLEHIRGTVVRESKDATQGGVALVSVEPGEARRMDSRLGGEPGLEDLIRPIAQLRHGAKVQGEGYDPTAGRIAEALPDNIVDVDVSTPEAVDGLLGITYDEQGAWPQRNLPPICTTALFRSG